MNERKMGEGRGRLKFFGFQSASNNFEHTYRKSRNLPKKFFKSNQKFSSTKFFLSALITPSEYCRWLLISEVELKKESKKVEEKPEDGRWKTEKVEDGRLRADVGRWNTEDS